jgi:hypothetical protein
LPQKSKAARDATIPQTYGVHSASHSNNQSDDHVVHEDHDSSQNCSLLLLAAKISHQDTLHTTSSLWILLQEQWFLYKKSSNI